MTEPILETVKSADGDLQLTKAQLHSLQKKIGELEQAGADAKAYREALLSAIGRSVLVALPLINKSLFLEGCSGMDIHALEDLARSLKKQAKAMLPDRPQLGGAAGKPVEDNHAFCI